MIGCRQLSISSSHKGSVVSRYSQRIVEISLSGTASEDRPPAINSKEMFKNTVKHV